ncbi:MAG: hypothetical protein AB7K09_09285 [Planctomycetota bacterium]
MNASTGRYTNASTHPSIVRARVAPAVALLGSLLWLAASLPACASGNGVAQTNSNASEATNDAANSTNGAANNDVVTVPINNGNGSGTPTGKPSETNPFEYDGAPESADMMYGGLVEVLQFRNLKTVAAPPVQLPTPVEVYNSTDYGLSPTLEWIAKSLATGHRDDYLKARANSLSFAANKLITNPPVFGKVAEEQEVREQLTRMIFAAQTDAFDHETSVELGRFSSAQAVLFTRITASFKSLKMASIMSQGRYWVRGSYKFEARLVLTEEAARVWTNAVEWEKFFIVSQY